MLVDNPILNSPFEEPVRRWAYEEGQKAQIDPEAFERMRGTLFFPFHPGEHECIAVKVIDFRGNEVVGGMNLTQLFNFVTAVCTIWRVINLT